MSRPDRRGRVRRPLVLLVVVAAALGGVAGIPARAQEATPTGDTLFGSYQLEARGTGVQAKYLIEGLLPGGAPVLDLTLPETLARFGSGPAGYGLASLAYPGGVVANLSSLIAQAGAPPGTENFIPEYPIKAEAFFPSGPTEVFSNQAGGEQRVLTGDLGVESAAVFPAIDATPIVKVGSVRSGSRTTIEDGKAVSRARVELANVDLLGGLITIDALVTDLIAAHDGTAGAADGGTTATGVKFLGLAAELTQDGLTLVQAPPPVGPAAPLGGLLDPLLEPLQQLTAPVAQLLQSVLQEAVPSLNGVLEAAGITIRLLGEADLPTEVGAAGRTSSGLTIDFRYAGEEQAALADLIQSIPAELRPSLAVLPNPLDFLTNNHVAGLTLGNATVTALASSPFDVDDLGGGTDLGGGSFEGGLPPLGDSIDFGTPTPDLPSASPDLGGTESTAISTAATAGLLLLVLLLSPLFGVASTRLADNVLLATATSCPSGLDQPPAPPRPT
ncbi:MAG: hypothetical protein M3Z03_08050 [Actinomycetota bacterium]|nr:hypothetical protein [Actinomycetota bacterium]